MGTKKKTRAARLPDGSKFTEAESERDQRIVKEVKSKIGYKEIDAIQMAAYLAACSNDNVYFSKEKVIERLEDICQKSNGLIRKEDFREMPDKPKSKFLFKPEVQGLLLLLLDTEYFDKRKNDRLLDTRKKLYEGIINNTKKYRKYLNGMDEQLITTSPVFMNAEYESSLSDKIIRSMVALKQIIMHTNGAVRLKLLEDSYVKLDELNTQAMKDETKASAPRLVFANELLKEFQDYGGELYEALIKNSDDLFNFIVMVLAFRVKLPGVNTLPNGEPLTFQNLYKLVIQQNTNESVIEEIPFILLDTDTKTHCEKIVNKKVIKEDKEQICKKVSRVLDLGNPAEKKILEEFETLLRDQESWVSISEDDVEISKRKYEEAMQQSMFDIFYEFGNKTSETKVEQDKRIAEKETKAEEDKRIAEKIRSKIGHEVIDITEIAGFLSVYSHNKTHFSQDRVKDRLEKICQMSNGLISKEDFRKTPNNSKSKFEFKPEAQRILLFLLDTGYFDKRQNDRLLSPQEKLYHEIVVNEAKYLDNSAEQFISASPEFMKAACECILLEKIKL